MCMLLLGTGVMYSQVILVPDSLSPDGYTIISEFYTGFPNDEGSWQIHKEAYIKQLKAKGFSAGESEEKIAAYEQEKSDFMKIVADLKRTSAEYSQTAAEQREITSKSIEMAEQYRKKADTMLKEAKAITERHALKEQNSDVQIQKAGQLTKEAETLMSEGEQPRRRMKESRNGYRIIFSETVILSAQSLHIKPVIIRTDKTGPLSFSIECELKAGAVLIEIFNPSGKKEGELSLEHKPKSDAMRENGLWSATSGSLHKRIFASEVGDWRIEISAKNSDGTVDVSVAL